MLQRVKKEDKPADNAIVSSPTQQQNAVEVYKTKGETAEYDFMTRGELLMNPC